MLHLITHLCTTHPTSKSLLSGTRSKGPLKFKVTWFNFRFSRQILQQVIAFRWMEEFVLDSEVCRVIHQALTHLSEWQDAHQVHANVYSMPSQNNRFPNVHNIENNAESKGVMSSICRSFGLVDQEDKDSAQRTVLSNPFAGCAIHSTFPGYRS